MNIFFGTDGWRAHLDTQINTESVAVAAQAFADYINRQYPAPARRVAVAYDTRRNSQLFAGIVAEVLSGNGIEALLADRILPTPVLSHATRHQKCCAGVMITASHNPPDDNGIKFKSAAGGPFCSEETRKVESLLGTSPVRHSEELVHRVDFLPAYIAQIEQLIDFERIRRSGLKLLIDSMGGAGTTLTQELLRKHGCPADAIYAEPSETFCGRQPEPIEKNLQPLSEALRKGNYALGVATDGDADRVGACLDNGQWLSAQNTILLLADYLKRIRKEPGGVVKTASVSDRIRCAFESEDTPIYEVQVGFKYIADVMTAHPVAFGGEESGGFGYGMHLPERDGIFSSLLLLEMLAASSCTRISDYLAERQKTLGEIHYDRIDLHYKKSDRVQLLPWVYESAPGTIGGFAIGRMQTFLSSRGVINGLKLILEGNCRWLLIRSSETEEIVRFYAEGQNGSEVQTLLHAGEALLHEISNSKDPR